jgi:hypothetical protein
LGEADKSPCVFKGTNQNSLACYDKDKDIEIMKKITARQGLEGAVVEFLFDHPNNFSFVHVTGDVKDLRFFGSVNFASASGVKSGTPWKIEFVNSTQVRLKRSTDNAPMYAEPSGSNILIKCIGPGVAGLPGNDIFGFCLRSNIYAAADLEKISLYDFLLEFQTIVFKGQPFAGLKEVWRPLPPGGSASYVGRPIMLFVEPSQLHKRVRNKIDNQAFKASCCNGTSDDSEVCQILKLVNENDACDNYMDQYCAGNLTDPACGCYEAAIAKEIEKLPQELQRYRNILEGQPRCWASGCKNGYIRRNYRDMGNCNITLCNLNQTVEGDSNIIKDLNGQMYCMGGQPIRKPEVTPQSTPQTPSDTINTEDNADYYMAIFILVVVFFIIFAIVLTIIKQRKNKENLTFVRL